jgi:hypothetical protein
MVDGIFPMSASAGFNLMSLSPVSTPLYNLRSTSPA